MKWGYQRTRLVVQVVVAAFVLLISIGHTVSWSWAASLHTICPFGGVVNLYTYFTTGGYVAKLHSAVFVMLLALVLGLVLTGKSFCGWICPLGTVQELLGKVGRRLWPRAYGRVPRSVDRVLRYAKYVILIWIVVQTARSVQLVFEGYDPYYNLFAIWSDEIAWTGYLVVGLTVLASLFVERPFSRYACPLGAINGLFNSFSLLQIKRDAATCIDCGRCDKACPVNVNVSQKSAVRGIECTRCLKCVEACPVNAKTGSTLKLRTVFARAPFGRRAIPAAAFMSVAVLAFAAPIAVTVATDDFAITRTFAYESAADIKGSSPIDDIVENFAVSQQAFYNGFGIPESVEPSTKIKDVQTEMGLLAAEELVVPENIRTVITYLDDTLATFVSAAGADAARVAEVAAAAGLDESATVRELMEKGAPGAVVYALTGAWPVAGGAEGGTDSGAGGATTVTTASSTGAAAAPTTVTTSMPTTTPTTTASTTAVTSATATSVSGEGAGETQTVKGSTTLAQIEEMVDDFPAFLAEFGIPASEPMTATMTELKTTYGFEMSAVRAWVAAHD